MSSLKFFTSFLLLSVLSSASVSQSVLESKSFENSGLKNNLSTPDFLPYDEAYKLSVSVDEKYLTFNWDIEPGYYLYKSKINVFAEDPNTQINNLFFQKGEFKFDEFFEEDMEVFYTSSMLKASFDSTDNKIYVKLLSQGCADMGLCYPPQENWVSIDKTTNTAQIYSNRPDFFTNSDYRIEGSESSENISVIAALVGAFLGGLILNLMPCVFPVLSIKALSFAQNHKTNKDTRIHALIYTLGVVFSFLIIAALMLSLRAAGESIGWGFQLQSSQFLILLAYLFFFLGLSFLGIVEIGTKLMSLGQNSEANSSIQSSFLTGVLAVTIASPCTAPFMGPALGFAVYQSNAVALLIFVFLGIGMAFPFLLLVLSPNIRNILPKPGKWMDEFKQFLAFPMFFTVVWLLWVIGRQTNITVMSVVIVGLILISMSVWSKKILDRRHLNKNISIKNLAPISLLVLAIILPFWNQTEDQDALLWESFDQARLEDLRSQGNPIFVNITADWCITCLANEKVAFTEKFYSQIKKNNITYLKGDWTNQDAVLTKLLNKHRRNGVPLYLMYPKSGGDPEVLPQILLEGILLKAIDRAVY